MLMKKLGFLSVLVLAVGASLWATGVVGPQDLTNGLEWTRSQATQFVRSALAEQTDAQRRLGYLVGETWTPFLDEQLNRRTWPSHEAFLHMAVEFQLIAPGLQYGTLALAREGTENTFDVALLKIDPTQAHLRVLSEASDGFRHTTVRQLLQENGATAAINASLFDTEGQPLGLIIQNGEEYHPANGYAGYFVVKHGAPALYINSEGMSTQGVQEAIQGYPTLMQNYRIFDYAKDGEHARDIERRSAIAVQPDGSILLLATDVLLDGLSFYELSTILGALGARDALALDGGRSTQLVIQTPSFRTSISGYDNVPVAIGVFPNVAP